MKIDSSHNIRKQTRPKSQQGSKADEGVEFGDLLKASIPGSGDNQAESVAGAAASIPISLSMHPGMAGDAVDTASSLLDRAECYCQMLSDPMVSLKKLEPELERLEAAAGKAGLEIDHLPEDHPVKRVVQEAATAVRQESERFRLGLYVDDGTA
jgi:hypothetical protein